MTDLIQITIFRAPDAPIETVNGVMTWEARLNELLKEMRAHGRVAKVKKQKGDLALYANRVAHSDKQVMRDATVVNVRGME